MNNIILFTFVIQILIGINEAHKEGCRPNPEMFKTLWSCCPTPEFLSKESMEKCKPMDLNDRPQGHHHKNRMCFMDCIYTENGLLKDGKIDMSKIPDELKASFTQCEQTVAATEDDGHLDGEPPSCNPLAKRIAKCVFRDIILNCPENVWQKDNPKCEPAKQWFLDHNADCHMQQEQAK